MPLPAYMRNDRRAMRAPVNPMDKSTVFSIYPRKVDEVKHTIQPGRFIVDPGSYDNPSRLVVGPSSWWRELDEQQELLEITVSSIMIADSIVKDFSNGILGCDMGEARPGLFFIMGDVSLTELRSKPEYLKLLNQARQRQLNWFKVLVEMADIDWSRSNGSPLVISADMQLAARELNLLDKDWMKNLQATSTVRCIACGHLNRESTVVCPNCKVVIDAKRFADMKLTFAS